MLKTTDEGSPFTRRYHATAVESNPIWVPWMHPCTPNTPKKRFPDVFGRSAPRHCGLNLITANGRFAASLAAPPAISRTRSNPFCSSSLAAVVRLQLFEKTVPKANCAAVTNRYSGSSQAEESGPAAGAARTGNGLLELEIETRVEGDSP